MNKKIIMVVVGIFLVAVAYFVIAQTGGSKVSNWCDWDGNYSIWVDVKDYNVTRGNVVDYTNFNAVIRAGHCEESVRGRVNVSSNIRQEIQTYIDRHLQTMEFTPSPFDDEGKHRSFYYTR